MKSIPTEVFRAFVRGYTWKMRMSNGAEFVWWTPQDIPSKKARKELFKLANGDYKVYDKADIEAVWRTVGQQD